MNYSDEWLKKQKFAIFGAGALGNVCKFTLNRYNSFLCFIDNSLEKQTTPPGGG